MGQNKSSMYFFKNRLLDPHQGRDKKTKFTVVMTKEGFTKIVNFMNPGAGVLVISCRHISHKAKMQ